jgi:hypothetical protein
MRGRAYDDNPAGIEEAIKSNPRAFALATRHLYILKVVWHLALTISELFLLILYNKHMLMMYGCLLIPD